jgi:anti-anti-sigma regulatory factor
VQASRSQGQPRLIVVAIRGQIARDDAQRLGEMVLTLLDGGPTDLVRCDLTGLTRSDAAVLDALCRMQMAARRHRCKLEILDPSVELCELLYLTGLTNVLPVATGSGIEAERQPE